MGTDYQTLPKHLEYVSVCSHSILTTIGIMRFRLAIPSQWCVHCNTTCSLKYGSNCTFSVHPVVCGAFHKTDQNKMLGIMSLSTKNSVSSIRMVKTHVQPMLWHLFHVFCPFWAISGNVLSTAGCRVFRGLIPVAHIYLYMLLTSSNLCLGV